MSACLSRGGRGLSKRIAWVAVFKMQCQEEGSDEAVACSAGIDDLNRDRTGGVNAFAVMVERAARAAGDDNPLGTRLPQALDQRLDRLSWVLGARSEYQRDASERGGKRIGGNIQAEADFLGDEPAHQRIARVRSKMDPVGLCQLVKSETIGHIVGPCPKGFHYEEP